MVATKGKSNCVISAGTASQLIEGDVLQLCIIDCDTMSANSYDADVVCLCGGFSKLNVILDCEVGSGWQDYELKLNNSVIEEGKIYINSGLED